jgi:hypothetical protein
METLRVPAGAQSGANDHPPWEDLLEYGLADAARAEKDRDPNLPETTPYYSIEYGQERVSSFYMMTMVLQLTPY